MAVCTARIRDTAMKCSRCGRSELSRSHRKSSERMVSAVLPARPYRCRHCRKRQWRLLSYGENRKRYIGTATAVFCLGVFATGIIRWMNAAVYEVRPAPAPVAATPAPVNPASAYKSILLEPAGLTRSRESASPVALTPAPLVHLWLGFRGLPPQSAGSPANTLVHGNGMRLSFPIAQ